jgi:hypothetical protein
MLNSYIRIFKLLKSIFYQLTETWFNYLLLVLLKKTRSRQRRKCLRALFYMLMNAKDVSFLQEVIAYSFSSTVLLISDQ